MLWAPLLFSVGRTILGRCHLLHTDLAQHELNTVPPIILHCMLPVCVDRVPTAQMVHVSAVEGEQTADLSRCHRYIGGTARHVERGMSLGR